LTKVSKALATLFLSVIYRSFSFWALFLKKFRGKQAISRLISLSLRTKIHPSFLQQTPVRPSKLVLIKFPSDFG